MSVYVAIWVACTWWVAEGVVTCLELDTKTEVLTQHEQVSGRNNLQQIYNENKLETNYFTMTKSFCHY